MLVGLALLVSQAANEPVKADCYHHRVSSNGLKYIEYKGDRQCVSFQPPVGMTGLWLNEFEGSQFFEKVDSVADVPAARSPVWLNLNELLNDSLLRNSGVLLKQDHYYRVRFIGRLATDMQRAPMQGYGHFGMSSGLVVVDQFLAIEDLGMRQR